MKTTHKLAKARARQKKYTREKHVLASKPDYISERKLEVHRQKRDEQGAPIFDSEQKPVMEHAGYKRVRTNHGKPSLAAMRSGHSEMIKHNLLTPKGTK